MKQPTLDASSGRRMQRHGQCTLCVAGTLAMTSDLMQTLTPCIEFDAISMHRCLNGVHCSLMASWSSSLVGLAEKKADCTFCIHCPRNSRTHHQRQLSHIRNSQSPYGQDSISDDFWTAHGHLCDIMITMRPCSAGPFEQWLLISEHSLRSAQVGTRSILKAYVRQDFHALWTSDFEGKHATSQVIRLELQGYVPSEDQHSHVERHTVRLVFVW